MRDIILWLRAIFGFNQKEINGFIVLSGLMVLLLIVPFFYVIPFSNEAYSTVEDQKTLDKVLNAMEVKELIALKKKRKEEPDDKKEYFKKTYPSKVELIKEKKEQKRRIEKEAKVKLIEINTADTLAFRTITGIGEKLSERIIKYREKLGGFVSVDQLSEVYGIDSALVMNNKSLFILSDTLTIRKLNVNKATFKELVRHPYLSYKKVLAIVNYREQHGDFKSIQDLLNIHLITENDIQKLTEYVRFGKN